MMRFINGFIRRREQRRHRVAVAHIKQTRRRTAPAPSQLDATLSTRPDLAKRSAFFRDHILIQTHIPKTAGSSLSAGISSIVGGIHTLDRRLPVSVPIEDMEQAELDDIHFLTAHTGYGQHVMFDRVPLYIAAVREPVDRAISYYRYLQNRPNEWMFRHAHGLSFEDSWHAIDTAWGSHSRNLQSRLLSSLHDDAPVDEDLLWQRVKQDYFLIIPHHKVNKAVQDLRAAFGVFRTPLAKVNVSKFEQVMPSDSISKSIRDANALDVQLYEYIEATFERNLEQARQHIAHACLQRMDASLSDSEAT